MTHVIDFKPDKSKKLILDTIRDLYPEKDFPEKLFPDLLTVLHRYIIRVIKSNSEWHEIYRKTENFDTIQTITRENLDFPNLLKKHPQTVVLLYRSYIKRFIKYKFSAAFSGQEEVEDIFQEILSRLLSDKIFRIREKYDFSYKTDFSKKSFFTSYLMVTVRNILLDIMRERKVRLLTSGQVHSIEEGGDRLKFEDKNMLNNLAIEEEFNRFRMVLALHFSGRPKLELCLKLKCRIPLKDVDVHCCFPRCRCEDLTLLSKNFKNIRDKELFDIVTPVFNRNEGKEIMSDTLRKWLSVKLEEIASHLNNPHGSAVYTHKSVIDFISLYYERYPISGNKTSLEPKNDALNG